MSLHVERGPMVLDEVAALPEEPLVVAEGTTLPAAHVPRTRALWLLPTAELQRRRLEERELPAAARQLYELIGETIEREATEAQVPVLRVDGSLDVEETVVEVERRLDAVLRDAPRATSTAERRSLLREANLDVVRQLRAFYARPWATGSADDVERSFACECGDPACTVRIDATVAAAAAGPVFGPGHTG
jgi:hypothetical protein